QRERRGGGRRCELGPPRRGGGGGERVSPAPGGLSGGEKKTRRSGSRASGGGGRFGPATGLFGRISMPQRPSARLSAALALGVIASFLSPLSATADDEAEAAALVAEVRQKFTLEGKTIPPEIFRDFGDGDMADSGDIWVTVDLKAA